MPSNDHDEKGRPQNEKELKPFLGLAPRLFLTAFSPAFLPLIFTIAHLSATRSSTAQLAAQLKQSVLDACGSIAAGAGTLQALPRYLAMQTNAEVLRATRATVLAVGSVLMDCITVIEVVVNFIVDTYRSLLLCTLQLIVQGSLEMVIAAVQTISVAVTSSLNSIRESIQEDIGTMNELIQKAVSGLNKVTSIVNVDIDVPSISIPSLNFLANVTIPTGFEDSLIKLNSSLPTLNELKEKMEALIDKPFHALKAEINERRLEIAASLNTSTFPVPSLHSLGANDTTSLKASLCGDLDIGFIDDTAGALYKLGTVAIGLICLVLILGWAVLAFWQYTRWRALQQTVEAVEDEWKSTGYRDAWTVVAVVESPFTERFARPIMDRFHFAPRTRTNVRWLLSYLGHPTCLTLLVMSVVGLLAIQAQLAALHALKAHATASANESIIDTTSQIADRLNSLLADASVHYAEDMNAALGNIEAKINGDMFGHWVNGTAVNLNNTLVEFYADVEGLIKAGFEGTPLFKPINTFVYCILGSKITSLEKGLTWVSEHAHIDLPTVPPDVLQLPASSTQELAAPISAAAVGNPESPDSGTVGKLVRNFEGALKTEQLLYGIMLAVYALLLLIGIAVVVWHSGGRDAWVKGRDAKGHDDERLTPSGLRPLHLQSSYMPPLFNSCRRSPPAVPEKNTTTGNQLTVPHDEPSSQASNSGSLRALAAPGAAFLSLREYLTTPTPPRAPTRSSNFPPSDATHPWQKLRDTNDDGMVAERGQEPAEHGFWVTRALDPAKDDGLSFPGARLGSSSMNSPREMVPALPESNPWTPVDERHSAYPPITAAGWPDSKMSDGRYPPLSPTLGRGHRFSADTTADRAWGSCPGLSDTTAPSVDTTLLTPPRDRAVRGLQTPLQPVRRSPSSKTEWDKVDALGASPRLSQRVQRALTPTPPVRKFTPSPAPSYGSEQESLTPPRAPGLGGMLQHLSDKRFSRRQRRADEERVDPFYSPAPSYMGLLDEMEKHGTPGRAY